MANGGRVARVARYEEAGAVGGKGYHVEPGRRRSPDIRAATGRRGRGVCIELGR